MHLPALTSVNLDRGSAAPLALTAHLTSQLDANGDGVLTPLELSTKLSDLGLGDMEIQSLFM